jgi:hypothetical protein
MGAKRGQKSKAQKQLREIHRTPSVRIGMPVIWPDGRIGKILSATKRRTKP